MAIARRRRGQVAFSQVQRSGRLDRPAINGECEIGAIARLRKTDLDRPEICIAGTGPAICHKESLSLDLIAICLPGPFAVAIEPGLDSDGIVVSAVESAQLAGRDVHQKISVTVCVRIRRGIAVSLERNRRLPGLLAVLERVVEGYVDLRRFAT